MSNPKLLPSSRKARVIGLLRPLKDVTVTAGETATFDCELSYEDIPVEWYLKGKKLEPSDQVKSRSVVACLALTLSARFFHLHLYVPCSLLFFMSPPSPFPFLFPIPAYACLIPAEIVKQILHIFLGFNLMIFSLEWK